MRIKAFIKDYIASVSVRRLIIFAISFPLVMNLIFINIFFFANSKIKRTQKMVLHSKDVKSDSKFFKENIKMLGREFSLADQNKEDSKERTKRLAPHFRLIESKIHRLLESTSDNIQTNRIIREIAENINRLKSIPNLANANEIIASVLNQVSDFLKAEKILESERLKDSKNTIDSEFNILIIALALTILFSLIIIFLFRSSFFTPLNQIIKNIEAAKKGAKLTPVTRNSSELSKIESEFYSLFKQIEEKKIENEKFIYSVSHDLRSPLLNIQIFNKELFKSILEAEDRLGDEKFDGKSIVKNLVTEGKESLNYIFASLDKISLIIESILSLSRAGKVDVNFERIDLNHKIATIVKSIKSTFVNSKAKIEIGHLPDVVADRTALNQIFTNLITNSIKYRNIERDLIIEIGENREKSSDDYKAIFVKDNAIGIPHNYLDKIFLPYEQVKSGAAVGEGLGLSIVKKLVEKIEGKIEVTSEEGVGTTFTVLLKA